MRRSCLFVCLAIAAVPGWGQSLSWNEARRKPAAWFAEDDAARVGDLVLLYQFTDGGWPKNTDMAAPLDAAAREGLRATRNRIEESTIDNGATIEPMDFLAKLARRPDGERFRQAFIRGLDCLLDAQYPSGGWPQFPHRTTGYYINITYNDNAMANVIGLLRRVAGGEGETAFVDEGRRQRAAAAVERGINCILRTQVRVAGEPTVWCAQHDRDTLAPAPARTYELVSLSGSESVGLTQLLMSVENPSPEIIAAVEGAVRWFDRSRIRGIRVQQARAADGTPDRIAVADPDAPSIWARFYDIPANKPIFTGRDGVPHATLAEIEQERRTGYAYYGNWPAGLLESDYPKWRERWTPGRNVLATVK